MNRIMFVLGGVVVSLTLALLYVVPVSEELGSSPLVLCITGLLLIGASKFRMAKM